MIRFHSIVAAVGLLGAIDATRDRVPAPLSAATPAQAPTARPTSGIWTIVPSSPGDLGLAFSLGWTLGTHQGRASSVTGSLEAQSDPLVITRGEFRVPIIAMSTGSASRDCHMREALGIDYTGSRFPGAHVCVNDQVPASGPDAVVYPEIVLRIRGPQPAPARGGARSVGPGQVVDVSLPLELSIHGVTRTVTAPLRLQWMKPDLVQAQTEFQLKLADFGIVVMMPPLMSVAEYVKVNLNLQLAEQSSRR